MTTDADPLCKVIKAINIVANSSHINVAHRIIALMLHIMCVQLVLCVQHVLVRSAHILQLVVVSIPQLSQQLVFIVQLSVLHRSPSQSPSKRDQLVIVRVMELRELSHSVFVDPVAVLDLTLIVLIALTLVLGFLIFFLIIASLV